MTPGRSAARRCAPNESPGTPPPNGPAEAYRVRGSQCPQQDGCQVAVAQRDGVALHAARYQGFGRDLIDVLRADAEGGQAGYGEQGEGLADPGQAVLDGRGGVAGQQPGCLGVAVQGGMASRPGP